MKTINYLAAFAATMACLSSCNKDGEKSDANDIVGPIDLKLELVANLSEKKADTRPTSDNVLAVLDVKSYNARTGEVVFNNPKLPDNIGEWRGDGYKVDVYANSETRLFGVDFTSSLFSSEHKRPVLYYSMLDGNDAPEVTTENNKWYILSGYPNGKVLTAGSVADPAQQESFKKIETGWNAFVAALKKSGKYIE